jgi:hypothetical protein
LIAVSYLLPFKTQISAPASPSFLTLKNLKQMKRILLTSAAAILFCSLWAQKTPFTPADAMSVVSFSVQDITDDGTLIAATTYTRRDRVGVDHQRYGDPGYVSPSYSRLVLLNTGTGDQKPVFPIV